MNDDAVKAFLDQFEASKQNIDKWPSWMQDSAKVACASFPKSHTSVSENIGKQSPENAAERKRS